MGCQTGQYSSDKGFMSIYYLGESIKSGICGINNQFRGIMSGGKKIRKSRKIRKTKKARKSRKSK